MDGIDGNNDLTISFSHFEWNFEMAPNFSL